MSQTSETAALPLERAEAIARTVCELLAPACKRLRIAGSVRRKQKTVGDIELVAEPLIRPERIPGKLFAEVRDVSVLDRRLQALVGIPSTGLAFGNANGERMKRLVFRGQVKIDLFLVLDPKDWGAGFALRTGPADFVTTCVTSVDQRGAMPRGMEQRDRRLWLNGKELDTPTEDAWFAALGLPPFEPQERSVEKLRAWIAKNGVRTPR